MRFEDLYDSWADNRLTQEEAAEVLGVCARTFRRQIARYEEHGIEGLRDRRLSQPSHRKAPVDEQMRVVDAYRDRYDGWNARHYHSVYRRNGGQRSYTWLKNILQLYKVIPVAKKRGAHRKRRERKPLPGMMLHQDGSPHEWVAGKKWDLIATLDDATGEHYSMFFCDEEGTMSSFIGVRETIAAKGLFCSLYTDRGSHYWHTPEAGGKVDKANPTQFGRAMQQLGVEMIPSYSPEARGRCERVFRTHQDRLVKELALEGITDMEAANAYLREQYMPHYNEEFRVTPQEEGSAFVECSDGAVLDDILCEHYRRVVRGDNCVQFENLLLQIPESRHRHHYVKAEVVVHRHMDGTLSLHHGPRLLARYQADGSIIASQTKEKEIAA